MVHKSHRQPFECVVTAQTQPRPAVQNLASGYSCLTLLLDLSMVIWHYSTMVFELGENHSERDFYKNMLRYFWGRLGLTALAHSHITLRGSSQKLDLRLAFMALLLMLGLSVIGFLVCIALLGAFHGLLGFHMDGILGDATASECLMSIESSDCSVLHTIPGTYERISALEGSFADFVQKHFG